MGSGNDWAAAAGAAAPTAEASLPGREVLDALADQEIVDRETDPAEGQDRNGEEDPVEGLQLGGLEDVEHAPDAGKNAQ